MLVCVSVMGHGTTNFTFELYGDDACEKQPVNVTGPVNTTLSCLEYSLFWCDTATVTVGTTPVVDLVRCVHADDDPSNKTCVSVRLPVGVCMPNLMFFFQSAAFQVVT